jgi:hypothetical protein
MVLLCIKSPLKTTAIPKQEKNNKTIEIKIERKVKGKEFQKIIIVC